VAPNGNALQLILCFVQFEKLDNFATFSKKLRQAASRSTLISATRFDKTNDREHAIY
jgi:hypothetical protein